MKKYPKTVSSDFKGQLVIPKEVRDELQIEEGAAFWAFVIENEGILLKRVAGERLSQHDLMMVELKENAEKISLSQKNIDKSLEQYNSRKKTAMEDI